MTLLISLCYLDEPGRLERNLKWLEYNQAIKEQLGFDRIVLLDNASDMDNLQKLGGNIYDSEFSLIPYKPCPKDTVLDVYRFGTHIPRTGIWEYPYCWRGLDYAKRFMQDPAVDKIIFLDSDFYVLTPKLADYVKGLDSGWTSFFNQKYGFPEAAINVLCRDQFQTAIDFPIPSYTHYNGQHMEWLLPFTHVDKDLFVGDRYGEAFELQTPDMDYYGQWSVGCPDMVFNIDSKSES